MMPISRRSEHVGNAFLNRPQDDGYRNQSHFILIPDPGSILKQEIVMGCISVNRRFQTYKNQPNIKHEGVSLYG